MMNPDIEFEDQVENRSGFKYVEIAPGERMILNNDIDIQVKSSKTGEASIKVERQASGYDFQSAKERASNVIYNYNIEDGMLMFDDYYIHNVEDKVKGQRIDITLFIPENTTFKLDENLYRYFYTRMDNNMDYHSYEMINHTWKLKDNTLICTDCKTDEDETESEAPESTDDDQSESDLGNHTTDSQSEDYDF